MVYLRNLYAVELTTILNKILTLGAKELETLFSPLGIEQQQRE
jgi:hypothetical protein